VRPATSSRIRFFIVPKSLNDPYGQREAGDVVIWVRDLEIVFEIIWKNTQVSNNARRFVQRIGKKRRQLVGAMNNLKFGVGMARHGWVRGEMLNALPVAAFKKAVRPFA
jgi:hypothetical protein